MFQMIFIFIFVLSFILTLAARRQKWRNIPFISLYFLLLSLAINTLNAANLADLEGTSGVATNWFHDKWMIVSGLLIAAILLAHYVHRITPKLKA